MMLVESRRRCACSAKRLPYALYATSLLVWLNIAPAPAQSTLLHGDGARGKQLIATCLGCHGTSGYHNAYPHFRIPQIGGQSEIYLLQAMLDYRDGKRINPTMQAQMQQNTPQQLADIAAYLAHGE